MIGPMQRHARDMEGAGLDASARLLTAAQREIRALRELRAAHPTTEGATWSVEQLLHGVVVSWVDEQIDAGVYSEDEVTGLLDRISADLASLEALRTAGEPAARRKCV